MLLLLLLEVSQRCPVPWQKVLVGLEISPRLTAVSVI